MNVKLFVNSYFKAMSKGETPPVKDRLEMPVATQKTDTGLTPGLLRVLNKQVCYLNMCNWFYYVVNINISHGSAKQSLL